MPSKPKLGRQRKVELKASLLYRASSVTCKAAQRNATSKTKQNKNKGNNNNTNFISYYSCKMKNSSAPVSPSSHMKWSDALFCLLWSL